MLQTYLTNHFSVKIGTKKLVVTNDDIRKNVIFSGYSGKSLENYGNHCINFVTANSGVKLTLIIRSIIRSIDQ